MIRVAPMRTLLVAAYMAGIYLLSATPGRQLAILGLPTSFFEFAHVPLYAGFAWVTLWALEGGLLLRIGLTAAVCMAFGLSDEWHQLFVPARVFSFADLGADAVGIALGITLREGFRDPVGVGDGDSGK